jgi:GLPGLI family protein
MKKIIIVAISVLLILNKTHAQTTFIDKATIQFEVKSNIKKTMGSSNWEEQMVDKMPTFKTEYYNYTFANNKSLYKFDYLAEKDKYPVWFRNENKNSWFTDYATGKQSIEKDLIGSTFNIEDSMPNLEWRMINENRVIAGFNCKKAVTKIFDSVYVFAFYTDEIMVSGGPNSIGGLPGMIMGMTIPRLFTSWIATKVTVNGVDVNAIKPIVAKKYETNKSLRSFIEERSKDWWQGSEATDEQKQQKARFIWGMLL